MPAEIMITITAPQQQQCQSQQREGHQSSSLLQKSLHIHFCFPFRYVTEDQYQYHEQTAPTGLATRACPMGTQALIQEDNW